MSQLDSANLPTMAGQPGDMASGFGTDPATGAGPAQGAPAAIGPGMGPSAHTAEKQRLSVYTMMLVLSFIAICTGITLLHLELEQVKIDPPNVYQSIEETWKVPQGLTY